MTRVFRNRAAAEAEGFHVRTGSPSQAYREVPVKNSPRIRLKYVGDVRTDLEAQLAEALESAERLREWISAEISHRSHAAEELGQGLAAWKGMDDCLRNGLLASYREEFTEALRAFRGEGEPG